MRRRRLLFRATHRGTFENDLMIGGFVRAHLSSLTEAELEALEAVMEMPDTILADWLTGRVPIPSEEDTPMLRRMREFLVPDHMRGGNTLGAGAGRGEAAPVVAGTTGETRATRRVPGADMP
jgi:antitoxin CptB